VGSPARTKHYAHGDEPDLHHQLRVGVSPLRGEVERKGRTKVELDLVIEWLTGFDESTLSGHLAAGTTFEDFFADARLNPHASLITGVVCGVRVEDVDDPLMQKIRYLDKLVDELAKGKSMERILRA
jgi:hypothetical protein